MVQENESLMLHMTTIGFRFGGMDVRMLKRLNDCLKDHEEVEEMIKRETYSSAPTPECINVATMIDGEQIETITTPDSDS